MLRPSTLTAFGVPSRTSLRSATFTKLDFGFDISHFPSLFKHIHSGPAFREAQGGVGRGSAVFVRADVRGVATQAHQELVPGWVSARPLPLFKHGSESG